jgi:hypothetical protein
VVEGDDEPADREGQMAAAEGRRHAR